MSNAFTTAAFLANQRFIESPSPSFDTYQDLGTEMMGPRSTIAGVIVVSLLLGPYVFMLLALSFYGSAFPRWTPLLDSFAMMRIGASHGEGRVGVDSKDNEGRTPLSLAAFYGREAVIKLLLETGQVDVNFLAEEISGSCAL